MIKDKAKEEYLKNLHREKPYDAEGIVKRLKQLRVERFGVSQYDFAVYADIREKTYSAYEAGRSTPPIEKLVMLANSWGFDFEEILCDKE